MEKISFIKKAKEAHGEKYVYDNLPELFNGRDKVPIICPEHGEFKQIARNHINTSHQGCPICGRLKANISESDTFEEFVEKAKQVHDNKFTYIKEGFTKTSDKIEIKCNKCGNIFIQCGSMHLRGCGCTNCNPPPTKLTTEQFKEKLNKTHPNLEVLSYQLEIYHIVSR